MYADDKPEPVKDKKYKVLKKGGVICGDRWEEGDVKDYLALPYMTTTNDVVSISIDDIASKLEAAQGIGKYQIVKDQKHPFKLNRELGDISFELREKDKAVFHVVVHDYKSWNSVCDKVFSYLTSTVAMWNKIPEYYTVKKSNDKYVISRNGKNPQKWYFHLKKRFVILVYTKVRQEDTKSKENAIAQIDQVIRKLDAIIDDKKQAK
jgi:hypothetical protein